MFIVLFSVMVLWYGLGVSSRLVASTCVFVWLQVDLGGREIVIICVINYRYCLENDLLLC